MKFDYVGTDVQRIDSVEKVTGEARYVADLQFPNMLHVKVVRSNQAHALIRNIDKAAAEAVPGVRLVATGKDAPWFFGDGVIDQQVLAVDRVRWHGEPVVAVVATTPDAAVEGADKVKIDYEPLPALIDVRDAVKADAELIHPNMGNYHIAPSYNPEPGSNVFHHYKNITGDPQKGFAESDVIVENEFTFPHLAHVQLEPHGCIARCAPTGRFEVWASTQSPFVVRAVVAEAFEIPIHMVTVRNTGYLGGGFGGKSDATLEPLTCVLAKMLPGYWVRYVLEREEMFFGSLLGRGFSGRFKFGAKKDGTLLAAEIDVMLAAGGYGWTGVNIVPLAGHNGTGPYYFPNLEIHARGVYTNTPPVGAYRGYGHPEGQFMAERQMDFLARELKMDPVQLRLKNAYTDGHVNSIGQKIDTSKYGNPSALIEKVAEELKKDKDEKPLPPHIKRGKGLAAFMKSPGMTTNAHSTVILKFNEDASVHLLSSFTDLGQGAHTAARQMAAEIMELPIEKVYVPRVTDTDFSPYEWQTVASRTSWLQSMAITRAWEKALKEIKETAAQVLEAKPEELHYEKGKVFLRGDEEKVLKLEEIVHGYRYPDGHTIGSPILVSGSYVPHSTFADEKGKGELATSWTFGCQAAEVEVNTKTGEIRCKRFITSVDPGRIINPALAKAQVVSAVTHGLSGALTEEVVYGKDGKFRNASLTDYKIFTPQDAQNIELVVHFMETPLSNNPIGCRPIAEHPIVAVAPALANAIADATGIDFFDLPLSSERMLAKLQKEGE